MKVLVLILIGYLVGSAVLCWCCCALAGAADRRANRIFGRRRSTSGEDFLTDENQPKRSRFAAVQMVLQQCARRGVSESVNETDADHPHDSGVFSSE